MQILERWLYYHWLVILDLWRLRRAFLLHVVIVAGICLPILILGALKRGHVAQLREDLLKSVTGRQVIAWSAQNGRMLEAEELSAFSRELPNVEIVVPESYRPVLVRKPGDSDAGKEVTVYATLPGDPMLTELGVASPAEDASEVVLSKSTADSIGVAVGDIVEVVLRRKHAGKIETGAVPFTVTGIFAASSASGSVGYVPLDAIEDIERFVRGNAVRRWSLPAFAGMSAADRYAGYLVFCKKNDDLNQQDMKTLADRALDVAPVTPADNALLAHLLREGFEDRLRIYRVMARQGAGEARRLAIAPSDVAALTMAQDDIALPWNEPLERDIDGKIVRLVGLSFPERRWLRGEFQVPSLAFPTDAGKTPSELSVKFTEVFAGVPAENATLALGSGLTAPLVVVQETEEPDPAVDTQTPEHEQPPSSDQFGSLEIPLAIVPAPLLAHLDALQRGEAVYDSETATFPPVPITPNYDKLRIYATSIDHVPAIVDCLRGQGYGVTSEFTRIKEIHDQDESLALLVQIVTWGVLLFGILTVSIVLIDSTDRKSKTIGIMRIMGVSSPAVSYMVMLRAAVIGICAAGVAAIFGWVFCTFLSWRPEFASGDAALPAWWSMILRMKPVALATLDLWQDRAFLLATVACSVFGSLLPAIKASRLDPFDAVIQSRGG